MKKMILFIFLLTLFLNVKAAEKSEATFKDQLSASFGMSNISYTQLQAAFSGSGAGSQTSESGNVSAMIGNVDYEFFTKKRRSIFLKLTGSLLSSSMNKYYALGTGMNWYFKGTGAYVTFKEPGLEATIFPLFRYYLGLNLNARYMAYTTKTDVRADVGVELGGHGGIIYPVNAKRGYKAEFGIFKGMGIETDSMNMQILLGITYFI